MNPIQAYTIKNQTNQNRKFHEMAADIRNLLQSDLCIAWRFDKKEGQFRVEAWDGELDEAYRDTVFLDAKIIHEHKFIKKGKPIHILDVKNEEVAANYLHREEAKKRGWTTLICVPLVHNKRIIGFIDSYTYQPFKFVFKEYERVIMSSLRAFATQAAENIRNIELSNRLETLQDINQLLTGVFDEQAILRQILSKSLELVGADLGHIYLKDIHNNELILKAWQGIPDEYVEHTRKLGQGLTGYVAVTGVAENIPDVSKESRHTPIPGVWINSKVAVPLRREEQIIGVLSVKSRFYHAFTNDDTSLLTALATQATIAIERARLNKHLQQISRLALGEDYTALLKYVVNAVRDLTFADVSLWMIGGKEEGRGQYLRIVESSGDIGLDYMKNAQLPLDSNVSINVLALREKRAIIRPDIQNDFEKPQFYMIERAIERGWHCFMAVPLIGQEGEPLGLLSLYSQEIAKFGPPEVQLMQAFANQVAIALQQQQQNYELKVLAKIREQQANELDAIYQTTLRITAQENLHFLLEALVEEGAKLLKGKGGKLYLRVQGQNKVRLVAAKNVDSTFLAVGATFFSGEGMTGQVLQRKKPLIVNNYSKWKGRIERVTHLFTSMIEVPLLLGEEVIGVLAIFDDEENKFTQQDIQILERLAQQGSLAIHNAQLFEKSKKRLQVLDALHKTSLDIVGRLKFDKLMAEIIDRAAKLMADKNHKQLGAAYLRCDHDLQKAFIEYSANPSFVGIEVSLGESLVGKVIESGKGQYVNSFPDWKDRARVFDHKKLVRFMKNLIEVPVKEENKVIAIIAITDASGKRSFSEDDIELLERFADLAAIAIEQANLFKQIQSQREAQTQAIHEMASSIPTEKPLNEILESLLDWTLSLMGKASLGEIRLLDETTDELVVQASRGELRQEFRRLPVGKGITGWVAKHKTSQLIADVREDKRYVQFLAEIRSELAVPMLKADKVIGVLNIEHPDLNAFTQEDLKLAEAIAGLAVVAIENNQLFQKLDDRATRLERLQKVTTIISTEPSDLKKVLMSIVDSLSQIFDGSPCVIRLYDTKKDEFTHQVAQTKAVPREQALDEPRSNGISRYVLKAKVPYYIEDFNHTQPFRRPMIRQTIIDQGIRAMAALPLKSENDVIGVLYLNLKKKHEFTKNDKQILELFANQAVVVVKNAQLYEQIQTQSEAEIKAIGEIATSIAIDDSLSRNEVLRKIVNSMVSLMGKSTLFNVRLLNKDTNELELLEYEGNIDKEKFPFSLKIGEGVTGWVAEHKIPLVVPDVQKDPRYLPGLVGGRSELAVPMLKGEELIGVLNIEDPKVNAFTDKDVQLAEAIAGLTVVALENAQLTIQFKQQIRVLKELDKRKSEFLSTVSHELRTPLTPIKTFLERLLKGKYNLSTEKGQNRLKRALKNVNYEARLVTNLLDLVRIQDGRLQLNLTNENITTIISHIVLEFEDNLDQQELSFQLDFPKGTDVVAFVDQDKFRQIISNLVDNAIKFSFCCGCVNLSVREEKDWIEIRVADTGIGIPKSQQERIFDRFHQVDGSLTRKAKGTGIGLHIVKEYVELHGGKIWVESEEEKGTTFTFILPQNGVNSNDNEN